MTEKEIKTLYGKFLFVEDRFTENTDEVKIFRAKRNLINYIYSMWMCVGWKYTKEMHKFIKEL